MARQRIENPGRSDAELITAVRAGDVASYEELYRRHVEGARAAARGLTRDRSEADDLVSEAFARVLGVLQRGGGPEMAFRPYLVSSVRNVFYDRRRKDQRLDLSDDMPEDFNRSLLAAAAADESPDRELVAQAFASLPERWQLVLWHTEVEGRSAAEVAPILGLAPNAVAALGYRAREGLRQAYLNAHVQASPPVGCRPTIDKLGAYVRDDISARDRRKVEEHLESCDRCRAIVAELRETSTRLRGALIPLVIGVPAGVYVSNLGAGGAAKLLGFRSRGQGSNPAPVAAAVAAAAVVVVGAVAFAVSRLNDDGAGDDVAAPAGTQGDGTGGPGGDGRTPSPPPSTPTVTSPVAPAATPAATNPPITLPTVPPPFINPIATFPPGPTSPPSTAAPPAPTAPPVTPNPVPTPPLTPPPTPPPTPVPTPPPGPPALSISVGQPSPAIAGFSVVLPFTVNNGAAPAAQTAGTFGRSLPRRQRAVPANAPFVQVTVPGGVTFGGASDPSWTCTVAGARTTCALPALADGASSSVDLTFELSPDVTGELRFETAVGDGTGAPTAGPTVIVLVAPAEGIDELFVDRADVAVIGNTVVTCAASDPVCAAARDGVAVPPTANDKQNRQMVRVGSGGLDGFDSSDATLLLPPGTSVLHAHLVWDGELLPGPGGEPPPDPAAVATVRLATPAGTSTVVGSSIAFGTAYRASADVTSLVADGGAGEYTVADVQVATGPGVFGSWALLVVFEDPGAPRRMIALSTKFATVAAGQSAALAIGGLPEASLPASLTLVASEGDLGLVGERVTVNGAVLSDAANPAANPFNGSINVDFPRQPRQINNFGLDIDRFAVALSGPEVEVRAESSLDRAVLGPLAVAVELES